LNDPTPPMSEDNAMMSEPRGSVSNVKRDKEVNTVAVLKPPLSPFREIRENTANAKIGDTMGEMYAVRCE